MTPDPPLFVLWYDFAKWLLNKTEKFPKKIRFTFRGRIDNLALDTIEGIIEARYSKDKKTFLRRIDLNMEKLRGSASDVSRPGISGPQGLRVRFKENQ